MGNFNIQKPTDAQMQALINLITALAKKYKIDPNTKKAYFKVSKDAPYLSTETNYSIA
jgi:N-acetyl-anhydromuramyl-L-alanine amidase AmpD